jgi:beta-galactosidase/beta-glucuronidase
MGPYVPYEFEFTAQAKEGENHVEVGIADLTPTPDGRGEAALELGVNPGWEAYGGIIRDVYAEVRPAVFIENVQWGYDLKRDDTAAHCQARVFVSSAGLGAARG